MFRLIVGLTLLASLGLTGSGWAYDPPERIWHKIAPRYNVNASEDIQYFHEFTWLGDQNGDGCDELLVCHEPYDRTYRGAVPDPVNIAELYFGGEQMSNEPALVFEPRREYESIGWEVSYLGNLTGNGPLNFALKNGNYDGPLGPGNYRIQNWYIDIYEGGDDLDTEPDYTLRFRGTFVKLISNEKPCDINGDGYDDLLLVTQEGNLEIVRIYFGGADFDTIPDIIMRNQERGWFGYYGVDSGFDLNGDNCDEIIVKSFNTDQNIEIPFWADMFLGGEAVDSIPILSLHENSYEGYSFSLTHIRMFADVNRDGFDDWGLSLGYGETPDTRWEEETWVFFGGDSLDFEPDRSLQPAPTPLGAAQTYGGDANGDGNNDVLVFGRNLGVGDMRIFLGSPWLDERYVVMLNGWDDWNMGTYQRTQGAYADYNGDGTGDFSIRGQVGGVPPRVGIYGGERRWRLSAPFEKTPPREYKLSMNVYPNPFNSVARVCCEMPFAGDLDILVLDQTGRRITSAARSAIPAGSHIWVWDADEIPSGIFFIQATVKSNDAVSCVTKQILHVK